MGLPQSSISSRSQVVKARGAAARLVTSLQHPRIVLGQGWQSWQQHPGGSHTASGESSWGCHLKLQSYILAGKSWQGLQHSSSLPLAARGIRRCTTSTSKDGDRLSPKNELTLLMKRSSIINKQTGSSCWPVVHMNINIIDMNLFIQWYCLIATLSTPVQ